MCEALNKGEKQEEQKMLLAKEATQAAYDIALGTGAGILLAIVWIIFALSIPLAVNMCINYVDKKKHPEKYKEKEQLKRFKKSDMLHELNVISWQYAELQKHVMKQQHDIELLVEKHYQTNEAVQTNSENIDTLFNKLKK